MAWSADWGAEGGGEESSFPKVLPSLSRMARATSSFKGSLGTSQMGNQLGEQRKDQGMSDQEYQEVNAFLIPGVA